MKYTYTYENLMKLGTVFIHTADLAALNGINNDDFIYNIYHSGYCANTIDTFDKYCEYALQSILETAMKEFACEIDGEAVCDEEDEV